jgi:hypothetical protein
MRIRIRTDISLPDGAEVQISHLASSKTWFDLDGGFRCGPDPQRRQAVELLVTDRPPDGVSARPAEFRSILENPIPKGAFLLLCDDQGEFYDYRTCKEFLETRKVCGVLFQDERGVIWSHDQSKEDDNLEQVSAHMNPILETVFGPLRDGLPALSDYHLTDETPPRISCILWWTTFGSNPKTGVPYPHEDAYLDRLLSGAREIHATGLIFDDEPAPVLSGPTTEEASLDPISGTCLSGEDPSP